MVSDDRGQLLLLGGLAMAIVFLAAIPLSNSLVVSESAATSDTVRGIDRTADREATVERDLLTIANRTDAVNDTDAFNQTLQNYSRYRMQVSGQQDAVYVNATLNVSASEGGKRTQTDAGFDHPSAGNEWTLVEDATTIPAFNFTVDDADPQNPSGTAGFRGNISDASGAVWRLRAYDPTPSGGPVRVELNHSSRSSWQTVCSGSTVDVDIAAGTCTTGGSTVPIPTNYSAIVSSPYDIEIDNGNRATGDYLLLGIGEFDVPGADTTFVVPHVDVVYAGPETSYNRTVALEGEP